MIDEHAHPFSLEPGPLDLSHVSLDLVDAPGAERLREQVRPTFLWHALLRSRLAARLEVGVEEVEAGFAATLTHEAWGEVGSRLQQLGVDAGWLETTTQMVFEETPAACTASRKMYPPPCGRVMTGP